MSFVDLRFLVFFPVVATLYVALPDRARWMLLLLASYLFYMAWKPEYGLLLFVITLIDFTAGLAMGSANSKLHRRFFLIASILANLGILFYFKYFNFFLSSLEDALNFAGSDVTFSALNILLPIGISFHIFQSMSYTIDVYMRRTEPVRHFGKFALYVSFFPQLVAGPIERPQGLLKQIMEGRSFDIEKARSGTKLMAWGFFKKLVIADNLAPLVNAVYADPTAFPGPSLIIATVLFTYQIYCDFSGYTDIARGAAKIFGYDLMLNFNRPFIATSIADFWRRWHISLSSWLRDYLYHPLALARGKHSRARAYGALFTTMLLIGLWHGANWNFIVFGALHGLYLIAGSYTARFRAHTADWLSACTHMNILMPIFGKHLLVFALVSFSLIFFRAPSLPDALYIATHMGGGIADFMFNLQSVSGFLHVVAMDVALFGTIVGILGILLMGWGESLDASGTIARWCSTVPRRWRFVTYGIASCAMLTLGTFGATQQFIYFQF